MRQQKEGCIAVFKLLVAHGSPIERANHDGETPLYLAATHGNHRIIEYLLSLNASVDRANNDALTPLHVAAETGCLKSVQLLVEHGADIEKEDGITRMRALHKASCPFVVQFLLEKGAFATAQDEDGWTPLRYAAHSDNQKTLELLVKASKVNVHEVRYHGESMLHIAARNGLVENLKWLLQQGMRVSEVNIAGNAPLHLAFRGNHTHAIELLLDHGADPRQENQGGWTPMHMAAQHTYVEGMKILLDRHPDLREFNNGQGSPLMEAVRHGQQESVRFLLERGASVEEKTLLTKARFAGSLKITGLLLSRGAKFESEDVGFLILRDAIYRGHMEVVRLTLAAGVTTIGHGETALYLAARCGYPNIVQLLLDQGHDIDK